MNTKIINNIDRLHSLEYLLTHQTVSTIKSLNQRDRKILKFIIKQFNLGHLRRIDFNKVDELNRKLQLKSSGSSTFTRLSKALKNAFTGRISSTEVPKVAAAQLQKLEKRIDTLERQWSNDRTADLDLKGLAHGGKHIKRTVEKQIKCSHATMQKIKSDLQSIQHAPERKIERLKSAKGTLATHIQTLRRTQAKIESMSSTLGAIPGVSSREVSYIENLWSKEYALITKQINTMSDVLAHLTIEKRTIQAAPILASDKPAQALHSHYLKGAQDRSDKALTSYIKLKGEGDKRVHGVSDNVHSGRLADMQKVFDSLIEDYPNTRMRVVMQPPPHTDTMSHLTITTRHNETFDFTAEDLKNSDLSKIKVTPAQLKKYESMFFSTFYGSRCSANNLHKLSGLEGEPAHKYALHVYSTAAYRCINSSMRGIPVTYHSKDDLGGLLNADAFREGLLHAPVFLQAFKALPNVGPTASKFLFRGEQRLDTGAQENFLNTYKQAVDSGKGFVLKQGLLSAAANKPVSGFDDPHQMRAFVLVKQSKEAKQIADYSAYPQEHELVHAERQLHVSHYHEYIDDKGHKFTYFIASPIREVDALLKKARADAAMEGALKTAKLRTAQHILFAFPELLPRYRA